MASTIITLINAFQASFAAYNLYLASISISNLQRYEEKSKKAAKYSNVAEHQLYKTRTTQASGTIAVFVSFASSAYFLGSSIFRYPTSHYVSAFIAALNIAILVAARTHVGHFWKGKAKVPLPGVGYYNEAITITQTVRLNMLYLIAGWVVGGGLGWIL
ncbi:hypothetical protein HYFRA_00013059 [Hymenoscyphus fraxineus]|uniref:Uncharacterized protein n=1 Tax=Hymenoscyphus fraxineus TaxID=746836 RepID=A0A9N9L565_9HELO|nr:hypothetical protein HYFRA_00013059 [Hymenoscyphus fraxineus]